MKDYFLLPQILKDFLSHKLTIEGKSQLTVSEYAYDMQTFFRYMVEYKNGKKSSEINLNDHIDILMVDIEFIRKIQLSDIYEYLMFLSKNLNNSPKTRARKLSCVRSFYRYLNVNMHYIEDNIVKELQFPKVPKSLPRYLELEEAKRLLSAPEGVNKERDYFILCIILNCALRVSEVKNLTINDIKDDMVLVKGKGKKERQLFLNHATKEALENYLKVRKPKSPTIKQIVLSRLGDEISIGGIQYIVKNYIRKAGLDATIISTHKLRHTAATLMYKYGNVDVKALQEVLGHENLNTTEIYTHIDSEKVKEAIAKNPLSDFKKK